MNKKREKSRLQPVMIFLVLTAVTLVVSGVLNLLDISQYTYKINSTTLEYSTDLINVENLFSITGLKYIFSETVSNFVNFAPFSSLIIILIGIGVMEKSGYQKNEKKYCYIYYRFIKCDC